MHLKIIVHKHLMLSCQIHKRIFHDKHSVRLVEACDGQDSIGTLPKYVIDVNKCDLLIALGMRKRHRVEAKYLLNKFSEV